MKARVLLIPLVLAVCASFVGQMLAGYCPVP